MEKDIYIQIHSIEAYHWWYTGRRKIVFEWLLQVLANYSNPVVLDLGCGTGHNLQNIQERGFRNSFGLDITFDALSFCRQRKLEGLICGDGALLPFTNQSFDVVIALDMLEHIKDDTLALEGLHRVLRADGRLVLFVPAFQFLWGLQDEVGHHFRRYTAAEIKEKMNKAGFVIEKLSYANLFLFPMIFAGRILFKFWKNRINVVSENDLSPTWSNKILGGIFGFEHLLLQKINFPIGVSLLCIAKREGS